ncbi:MAG: hypothetical protein AEth_00741 [Candidatus Argoarchaeum ethanivorans]|uniref:Uncharacterized protein n=1 Tax=Candidatus Argoarchaeum ethanivorans TaxID=2608793 RepID=A0A8B3S3N6_9EURY|nr:MAG: hypothetical protein AEth_00741 [Candidatus Argoarchaeum ethanivorans]
MVFRMSKTKVKLRKYLNDDVYLSRITQTEGVAYSNLLYDFLSHVCRLVTIPQCYES